MTLTHFAIIAVCAYLFGSLSFAIIVSKVTLGKDIRNYGSGNAGLTNAYRTMGAKKTLFVLLGDIAKGAAAVSVGWALGGPVGKLTAGIFVILGHMFPLYFGFKGGKGVLVGVSVFLVIDPIVFGILILIFAVILAFSKYVSLSSIIATICCPFITFLMQYFAEGTSLKLSVVYAVLTLPICILVIFMHRTNITRLKNGTENRFSFHKKEE